MQIRAGYREPQPSRSVPSAVYVLSEPGFGPPAPKWIMCQDEDARRQITDNEVAYYLNLQVLWGVVYALRSDRICDPTPFNSLSGFAIDVEFDYCKNPGD
jgi:hypothetical protein